MPEITFTCEIVTPMFIGNAIPGQAELRPSAIKGALRFWWRAMHGDLPLDDIKQGEKIIKKGLRTQEAEIFGSADDKIGGRSKISIDVENNYSANTRPFINPVSFPRRINKSELPQINNGQPLDQQCNILEYLAYGPVERIKGKGMVYREYYPPDTNKRFVIKLAYPNSVNIQPVLDALKLCSVFGGLGSRIRSGFGRFKVHELTITTDELKELISVKNSQKDFTALSADLKLYALSKTQDSWQNVLGELGKKYFSARVKYTPSSTAINALGIEREHDYKLRPYLGAPLMVNKNSKPLKTTSGDELDIDRHSKTHFFGIIKNGESIYQGYVLHLPYDYLNGFNTVNGTPLPNRNNYSIAYKTATDAFNNSLSLQPDMQIVIP